MPYNNDYNEKIAENINALNRKYILNEEYTLDPKLMAQFSGSGKGKLEGGFLGALAGAVLPMVLGKLMGNGMAGGMKHSEESMSDEEEEVQEKEVKEGEGLAGGAMYNSMRDKMEGMGKASKAYKKQSEDKFNCGMGMSGGSAFGVGVGSVGDTGEGVTDAKNLSMGKSGGKKRGRKSKMGAGVSGAGKLEIVHHSEGAGVAGGKKRGRRSKKEGAGFISDLGIPLISNVAGLFGLGASGGARSDPIRPEKFYPKVLAQTAPNADKSVPPAGIIDSAQNIGSNMSGMGKKKGGKSMLAKPKEVKAGGKKANPWMELMAKVRKERPELKGVKAVADFIKKNNLYKK
jgi:hypothetical protein